MTCVSVFFGLLFTPLGFADTAAPHDPSPKPKIEALLDLLSDPQVRAWLDRQARSPTEIKTAATPSDRIVPHEEPDSPTTTLLIAQKLKSIREHFVMLAAAIPNMAKEFRHARIVFEQEFDSFGRVSIIALVAAFVLLGFLVEWLFHLASRPLSRKIQVTAAIDDVSGRVRMVGARFLLGVGLVASYTLGSLGIFLAVDWSNLLREILLIVLMAFLGIRTAMIGGRFLFSPASRGDPSAERFRLVPVNDRGARFWYRAVAIAVAWACIASAVIQLLDVFGFSEPSLALLYDVMMLGIAVIAITAIWLAPPSFYEPSRFIQGRGHRSIAAFDTVWLLSAWLLWVSDATGLFALLVIAFGLPTLVAIAQRSINHVLRPPGVERDDAQFRTVQAVVLERGVRGGLIIGAAYLLGQAWGIDLASLTMVDTTFTRIVRDALNAVVIILVADLVWHVVSVTIDNKLRRIGADGIDLTPDSERQARQRTLLPILRNVLLVSIVIITGMTLIAGMGVAIGPLIASAGVLGVAIGFGSQTLVRDIISGLFYLFDDAFRVGEYIQSGSYKGTVESFSLRSIKLRHHRGALYTVPFGSLGAVQNMSRDWTIEKMTIGVAYDTDVAAAKKLVKQVGRQLLEDPELAPSIIETLKLQGIESFGDYAIHLRVKIMTRAGEQFTVKRRALALIKTSFEKNGVAFATPTVQVSEPTRPVAVAGAYRSLSGHADAAAIGPRADPTDEGAARGASVHIDPASPHGPGASH